MIIENVVEEGRVCDLLDAAYRFAKQCQATHIVFLNTFNPQSTLNENRFAVNFLKEDENGNECIELVLEAEPLDDSGNSLGQQEAKLMGFYLVNLSTNEVIDEHKTTW